MAQARHDHDRPQSSVSTRLGWTLALVLLYAAAEVVGGIYAGSLALVADAGHMLSDAAALGLSLFAIAFARRPPTARQTYGFHRAEILAALVNGATLVAIAIFIGIEAVERLREPTPVAGPLMLAVAVGGLVVNIIGLVVLHGDRNHSLNLRGAWLHVLTDALGSVQAIGAAALIWAFGWNWVDPVASIAIALLVVHSSWTLLRHAVAVLMESAPGDLDVDAVRSALLGVEGVTGLHDLHVWSITTGFVALSAHLVVREATDGPDVLARATATLGERFAITHVTLQIDVGAPCGPIGHAARR